MTPVRPEPAAPRFRFKHSTTEPLRSLKNNLSYSDRYFNTDKQIEMFKRGKPMDMILVKCIFQNRFPLFQ